MTTMEGKSEIESQSLPAHVTLCAERYAGLNKRLNRMEYWLIGITLLLLIGDGTVLDVAKRLFLK